MNCVRDDSTECECPACVAAWDEWWSSQDGDDDEDSEDDDDDDPWETVLCVSCNEETDGRRICDACLLSPPE